MGVMKFVFWSGVIVGLLLVGLLLSTIPSESTEQTSLFESENQRKSITFLLGSDKPGYQYFKLAEEHFLYSPKEKSDELVKTCRSLEDLIQHLNNAKDKKYSTIQVVLHGNPYSGLSIPINQNGQRATPKNLMKAMMNNPLTRLKSNAVDSTTRINFWACGIGKNPFINIALMQFFTLPDGSQPKIYTSPHFVIFKSLPEQAITARLNASYWPYFYKRGYRPGDLEIAQALSAQYPDAEVNWHEAIKKEKPSEEKDAFQNSFHIPVSWVVVYPSKESRPEIKTNAQKLNWVKNQSELMNQVEESNIPLNKFNWTVNKIIHTNKNGEKVPAIKAIGMATVLCVLGETDEV